MLFTSELFLLVVYCWLVFNLFFFLLHLHLQKCIFQNLRKKAGTNKEDT